MIRAMVPEDDSPNPRFPSRIAVANAKGGAGKSTVATNLAAALARQGQRVTLADMDAQRSSLEWLRARPRSFPAIRGMAVSERAPQRPPETDTLILDTPGGHRNAALRGELARADTILVPVLPSPMDIRAAAHFIHELLINDRVSRQRTRIAVVANRARTRMLSYRDLERFLGALGMPFLTTLRESRNYLTAADQGLGIHDLAPGAAAADVEQWAPILDFLAAEPATTRG
jgi:chromosome partitioning protein